MAKLFKLDEEGWKEWVAGRPPGVQALCERLPPDRLYRMKSTGNRVTLHSYAEDGTVTVNISADFNAVIFERQVFGINPDDLEECDLPRPDEPLGALLTEEADIKAHIDAMRAAILAERNSDPTSEPR